jgi:RimJ/RimL family protein N-acetyltransferase
MLRYWKRLALLYVGGRRRISRYTPGLSPFWGQGFGTEMAQAVLAYGMAQYLFVHCTAAAFVEHTVSRRILKKLGFRVECYGAKEGPKKRTGEI